ncbi:hypothetical protein ACKWTF_015708 [Chironomus riparius]
MKVFILTSILVLLLHQTKKKELQQYHLVALLVSLLWGDIEIILALFLSFCILHEKFKVKLDQGLKKLRQITGNIF